MPSRKIYQKVFGKRHPFFAQNLISFFSLFLLVTITLGIIPLSEYFSELHPGARSLVYIPFAILVFCWTFVLYNLRNWQSMHEELAAQVQVYMADMEISQRDALEAKQVAERATIAKSEFLATMSHEIRTPMNAVLGMTRLLQESPLNDEQRHWAGLIRASGDNLLCIINDILDFSKIESGKLVLEKSPFALHDLLREVVTIMSYKAQENGNKIILDIEPGTPDCSLGDAVRLRQILLNLIGNAVKFTKNGVITLCIKTTPISKNHFLISAQISDTGIGIAAEKLAHIFDKFTQAEGSTTRRYGGTGLGLSIVKHLVTLMGGTIRVESAPQKGSVFTFEIPLETARQSASAGDLFPCCKKAAAILRPREGIRVLIAEDIKVNQLLLSTLIKRFYGVPTCVLNGREALARLTEETFDIVFMDCHMPEMDGFTATKMLRSQNIKTPVIAVTADAMAGDREKCLAAGMDDYINKPYTPEQIGMMLHKWV